MAGGAGMVNRAKVLLGAFIAVAACCCGAFELKDGTFLRNAEFKKVSRRGLIFSHSDGLSALKPEDLLESEQIKYADQIKEYQQLKRRHKIAQEIKARNAEEDAKRQAEQFKKEKAASQKEFNLDVAKVSRVKGKARYEKALLLLKKSKMTKMGQHLDYTALEKVINDSKKAAIQNPRVKDVRKVAYILILRVYIFKIADRIDAAKTAWEISDFKIKVENMRDKLWRLMRSLDATDQVICAEFFKHKIFVSGGEYTISPPVKALWEKEDNSKERTTGWFGSSYSFKQPRIDVANGMWVKYECPDICTWDTWEFIKYLVKPSREFGPFVKRYIKQEDARLNELLEKSYLTMKDVDEASVDRNDVLRKCVQPFLTNKLSLKCGGCLGFSINGTKECRDCSRYGIMLWNDYTSKTDK